MLKIKNYNKLFRKDVGDWRIGSVQETLTSYIIQLNKPNNDKKQVMLERTATISKQNIYELWCWNTDLPTATPKRIMLTLDKISDMDNLVGTIEFLVRD